MTLAQLLRNTSPYLHDARVALATAIVQAELFHSGTSEDRARTLGIRQQDYLPAVPAAYNVLETELER